VIRRYEKYKDSGIEWIGEIPEEWVIKKLKYVAEINPTKDQSIDSNSMEPVTFLPMERVGENGEIDCEVKKPIKDLWSGFTFFRKNDVIIAKITPCFENGKGALLNNLETEIGFGSTEFHVLRANSNTYPEFLFYLSRSEIFMKVGEAFMSGAAGQKRVPTDFISEFVFSVPSLPEQTAIASFLDRKTAEIDQLIANKAKLIALYEEEKTTIINHAVSKGLDPKAKTRPSGVDWLGVIPEHWGVKRLKWLCSIISKGTTPSTVGREVLTSGAVRFIKAENIFNNSVVSEPANFIDDVSDEILSRSKLEKLDILFVIAGATLGKVAILTKELCPANTNQAVSFIRLSDKQNVSFVWYWLQCDFIKKTLWLEAVQSAQPNLSMENLGNFCIPFPPASEQTAIVTHIEAECSRLDTIIDKFKKQIELFKEYRTTLISEVVTGKIDVRDEVAA
jgi:restriction endonuclease S subunit